MILSCAIAAGLAVTVLFVWFLFSRLPDVIRAAMERWRK
jgi:hypothetical protein